MVNRCCFITSLFVGKQFTVYDQPAKFQRLPEFDYIMFTNLDKNMFDTSWDIVTVDFDDIGSSVTKSRYPKFQGWKLLNNKYDVIIYCDAFYSPVCDAVVWNNIVDLTLKSESGIIQNRHTCRNCAYRDCRAVIQNKKDTYLRVNETIRLLQQEQMPKEFGLFGNSRFAYTPHNIKCRQLFDYVWELLKDDFYTHRDQPLYMLACFKTGVTPDTFDISSNFEHTGKIGKHTYV